ncbi:MAG: hypothetical protein KDD62_08865 [Bdellovibrionales bacterium]|nr:hypothetical protein [Bdellovibrionales bacterium]
MSKGNSAVIDFLDVEALVPETLHEALSKALTKLQAEHDHVELEPKFKAGRLLINSTDAVSLLGYVDPREISEHERKRIQKLFANALEQALIKTTSLDRQNHYKWCLAAVKSFTMGRFLTESSPG